MINASQEIKKEVKKNGPHKVLGYFPIDGPNEHAHNELVEARRRLEIMKERGRKDEMEKKPVLDSAISNEGKTKYLITCGKCGVAQGYVWAKDDKLTDWSDFHYLNWSDGKQWYGCLVPHVSPIDGKLCLLCCCGQDTRDFRANMTLGAEKADEIEAKNKRGRNFGTNSSKFKVKEYKGNIKLWQKPHTQQ